MKIIDWLRRYPTVYIGENGVLDYESITQIDINSKYLVFLCESNIRYTKATTVVRTSYIIVKSFSKLIVVLELDPCARTGIYFLFLYILISGNVINLVFCVHVVD